MTSNTELEMRWVGAWNDLDQIVGERWYLQCLLPDGRVVSMDECQGWLQASAYDDWQVKVEAGLVWGKQGVVATRWRDEPISSQPSPAPKRKR